jgi:Caspase domain
MLRDIDPDRKLNQADRALKGAMTRKALIVGIDNYRHVRALHGCANDARAVAKVLERNADVDSTVNFEVKLLVAPRSTGQVLRKDLRSAIRDLFIGAPEVALFYFAGHGHIEEVGGYLFTSDSSTGDEGISLEEILTFANKSKAENKIVVLDSCHSGIAGTPPDSTRAQLSEGLTVLTASGAEQYATEQEGAGLFTTLLVDALDGAAADLLGRITPGAVYAHIDQSLGAWEQRPLFKTNVNRFVSLRQVSPPVELAELRHIAELFPTPGYQFRLDPSFEPESVAPHPANTSVFRILQKYNRVNLVVPVGAPHMYHAAIQSATCRLTALGEHFRRLAQRGRL